MHFTHLQHHHRKKREKTNYKVDVKKHNGQCQFSFSLGIKKSTPQDSNIPCWAVLILLLQAGSELFVGTEIGITHNYMNVSCVKPWLQNY